MKAIQHATLHVATLAFLAAQAWAADQAAPIKQEDVIRKLEVKVNLAGAKAKPGVRVASDEQELTKLLGEATAKQFTGKIDFTKENLVHVVWGSSGPPFGKLRYEIKDEKADKVITFFVKVPQTLVQGQAYRLGNDFFAVPKNSKVTFGGAR